MPIYKKSYRLVNLTVILALLLGLFPSPLSAQQLSPSTNLSEISPQNVPQLSEPANSILTTVESLPPLSLARVQAAYTQLDATGDEVLVSFAVRNTLPPSHFPSVSSGSTISESVGLMAEFDVTEDINTLRNVILTDQLVPNVSLVASSSPSSQTGQSFSLNLGHIPPATTIIVTATLDISLFSSGAFLDNGAIAYANYQGRAISAVALPVILLPDTMAEWLISTPDADLFDRELLAELGVVGGDSQTLFELVRGYDYQVYNGSLRGTRGTLWSRAGNSLDQSSLLIAMLRASGIPARYRHGTLGAPEAQTLIESMFPDHTRTLGVVPAGTALSDPANDPELLAEASDHWWVEAFLPSIGWTDLDPSFANATPGDQYVSSVATDGSDRIAEIPDAFRHKVGIMLEVERAFEFPLQGNQLQRTIPLSVTLNSVALTGRPLNLHHIVNSQAVGFVLNQVEHTYTPILTLGKEQTTVAYGDSYQELLTSVPLASYYLTGMWLTMTEIAPNGQSAHYRREVKDVLGPAVRRDGGAITATPRSGTEPFIQQGEITQIHTVSQSRTPFSVVEPTLANMAGAVNGMTLAYEAAQDLPPGDQVAVQDWFNTHEDALLDVQMNYFEMLAQVFLITTSADTRPGGRNNLQTVSYPETPKFLLINRTAYTDTTNTSFELLDNQQRTLAAPGQDSTVVAAANMLRTMGDKEIEVKITQELIGQNVTSAFLTVNAAIDQNIPTILITPFNSEAIGTLNLSAEAKARIAAGVEAGNNIFVPTEPVSTTTGWQTGWIQFDRDGNATFVGENGRQAAEAAQSGLFSAFGFIVSSEAALILGVSDTLIGFVVEILEIVSGLPCIPTDLLTTPVCAGFGLAGLFLPNTLLATLLAAVADAAAGAALNCYLLTGNPIALSFCLAGVLAASAYLTAIVVMVAAVLDPTLMPGYYDPPVEEEPHSPAVIRTVSVAANSPAGTVDVSTETPLLSIAGPQNHGYSGAINHTFGPGQLATGNGTLKRPNGTVLATGALSGSAEESALLHSPLTLHTSGAGLVTTYAEAGSGLIAGSNWSTATASLQAISPFTTSLYGAEISDGSAVYSGSLDLVANDQLTFLGDGNGLPPALGAGTAVTVSQAQVLLGINTGGITVNGSPLAAPNGLAVLDASTTISVSEQTLVTDKVQFAAAGDYFTLNLDPGSAAVIAGETLTLTAKISTTLPADYNLAVNIPPSWTADIGSDGTVVITTSLTTTPDTYNVWVAAQSANNPDLIVSAEAPVAVSAIDTLDVTIEPLIFTTIPMGTIRDPEIEVRGTAGHLPNGQAEVPDAAWEINIANQASISHTYQVSVVGFPAGWMQISDDEITLQPGKTGITGLYLIPPAGAIMAPGTTLNGSVTVTALDDGSLTSTQPLTFVMPALPFPFPQVVETNLITQDGSSLDIDFTLTNVGNVAGTFPVTATLFASLFDARPVTPTQIIAGAGATTPLLAPDETVTHTVSLSLTGVLPGRTYYVLAESRAGEYRPQVATAVRVVSANAAPLLGAADDVAACSADSQIGALFAQIAISVDTLDAACSSGNCNSSQRDAVVDAVNLLVDSINAAYPVIDTAAVSSAAAALAVANTPQEIINSLPDISSSVTALVAPYCALASSQPALQWTPAFSATLTGDAAIYTLDLTNLGTLTTAYTLTVDLPTGPLTTTPTVPAGATQSFNFPLSSTVPALLSLEAAAVAGATPLSQASATAALNVVDRLLQLTAVNPNPTFVETGASQSTISIDVTNAANVPIKTDMALEVVDGGGGILFSTNQPLLIRPGNPRSYALLTLDTSGYPSGVYTVTVDLKDLAGQPIDGGQGYGFIGVGQALGVNHWVSPAIVAPGTATVTTSITTSILVDTIVNPPPVAAPLWQPTGTRERTPEEVEADPSGAENLPATMVDDVPIPISPNAPAAQTGIIRVEENDAAIRYDGQPITTSTWSLANYNTASAAVAAYNGNQVGATVSYDFTGDWFSVGLMGNDLGGQVEVAIDGLVQGQVDTYRRFDSQPINLVYAGLGAGSHTITMTVQAASNPNSGQNRLYVDYFETWDGANEPAGTVEADFVDQDRIRYSNNWALANDANAAGGSYVRSDNGNIWFHFTGDSVTYEAFAYNNGDLADIWIDGAYQTTIDLYSQSDISRTLTFDSLGAGPHVMLVRPPRDIATVDRFHTPAIEPATALPICGAYCRYEENDPAMRFNGEPFNVASTDFFFSRELAASDGYLIENRVAGNSISLSFDGAAAAVGFFGDYRGGLIEVMIDGVLVETVDTFRTNERMFSRFYPLAVNGSHTISATLTGSQHPNAGNSWMRLDFIDVWDGSALPGTTQEVESMAYFSDGWVEESDAVASGGLYWRSPAPVSNNHRLGNIWIPFEGDSVQFDAILNATGDPWARIYVDGVEQPFANLWNDTPAVGTFAFAGFGPGAHLLQIEGRRDRIALDTVTTPAAQAAHTNPVPAGLVRFEEFELTYDGYDWAQRPSDWARLLDTGNVILSTGYSDYEAARTNGAGRTATLAFSGSWVNVGLRQYSSGGTADIFIDGLLQQTVNLNGSSQLTETQFALVTGTHTISITAVGDGQVTVDFIDVYDGTPVGVGEVDAWLGDVESNTRVHFSNGFGGVHNVEATNGRFADSGKNAWYTFLGDSVTFYAFSTNLTRDMDVYIDGQFIETVSLEYDFTAVPLAFHYSGLGAGPHTMRIRQGSITRIDGFAAPATNIPYRPIVEWNGPESRGGGVQCGLCSGITAGDINDDGVVELVFGSDVIVGNDLFVYRGDGSDSGDGDAVVWRDPFGSSIGTPALGELDPAYPGTEIVAISNAGLRVYHADGTLWWENPSVTMYNYIGAPALGNLDADPEPEIVVNAREDLIVLDADGTVLWSVTKATRTSAPILADFTGDGLLDIFFSEYGKTSLPASPALIYLYDYNLGSPNLVFSQTLTTTLVGLFGSHAVADIDGLQPGGDPGPEIAVSHEGFMTIFDADGSVVWSTALDPGAPGGVSIADLDGDGEVEIVTSMKYEFETGRFGKLYALNADGTILWDVVAEDSTSANSSAVLDLNGDGIYEVAWNGLEGGFNIFNGADGSVLFHEPAIFTRSGTDHPIIVDVDNDDSAEIVIATQTKGVVVLGFDGIWDDARSLWNQHTYHITNVNDDLTIPDNEIDSWDLHNTYKTQYPGEFVLPIFGVTLSHTVGIDDLAVNGFNVSPDVSNDPEYRWNYVQSVANPTVTRTLELVATNLVPGESRQVAAGTTVSYTQASGQNRLLLPPLYITAARLVALSPFSQTIGAGSTAIFTLTVTNPGETAAVYNLALTNLEAYTTLPDSVIIPAQSSATIPLLVATPAWMAGQFDFVVLVNDGLDSVAGRLIVVDALDLDLTPPQQAAGPGQALSYTLTITNHLSAPETISLSVAGLPAVSAPPGVVVGGNSSETVILTASGVVAGQLPFSVTGANSAGANDSDSAILDVAANASVGVDLEPVMGLGGPGTPAVFTMTVTNLGQTNDTYSLTLGLPAGWSYRILANDTDVNSIALTHSVFNEAALRLLVTPDAGATPGLYPITAAATSQAAPSLSAMVTATVEVLDRGVQVGLNPSSTTLNPADTGVWQVTITNTGSVADSYWLSATGIVAVSGQFSANPIALNPGQSAVVNFTAGDFDFALPTTYAFAVVATSQADGRVRNEAVATFDIAPQAAVQVAWKPASQEVPSATPSASFLLVVTNTGNVNTTYYLSLDMPGLYGRLPLEQVLIPARTVTALPLSVRAGGPGLYTIDGLAAGEGGAPSSMATATLLVGAPTAIQMQSYTLSAPTQIPAVFTLFFMALLIMSWAVLHWRRPKR